MKKLLQLAVVLFTAATFAQAGHIMQGVGAVNMSMGGAATAMPLDIDGAIQWNPAGLSEFNGKILSFDIGAFFSSPELHSSIPAGMMGPGSPGMSGYTKDDRGASPMPAIAFAWGKEDSRSTFAVSAFGISGFGVTFPENMMNPISVPQSMGGFGHIESDYMLMQVGLTWAFEIAEGFSFGIQPTMNYASLELEPNPLSPPSQTKGYPVSNKASAFGYGAQFGLYYASKTGIKIGASYKTNQKFEDFNFKNTYLDGSDARDVDFRMDYPSILSIGLGYSQEKFDLTVDFRNVDYSCTEGFKAKGWGPLGMVNGFGWNDAQIISAGLQLKVIDKLPLRFGYTYSTNPIDDDLVFFSIPATAIIKHAYQFGLGYEFSDKFKLNGVYHYGTSGGAHTGNMLNPMMASPNNPYGAIPGTSVGYKMNTSMIMVGIAYNFAK